jgi:histidinol phosphatase-like enzyme (inositol monophosphatase family)
MMARTDCILAPAELAEVRAVAAELADAARRTTLAHFRSHGLDADTKQTHRFDPVTVADRETEAALREILGRRRPHDAVLGEELAPTAGTSGLTWVIDPIDGTRSFLSGTPTWGVLIALCDARGPIYGLIDQPFIGERFEGGPGLAQTVGPMGTRALAARGPVPLSQAILFSTFPEVGTRAEGEAFRDLAKQVKLVRYGLDCYAYALIAAGHVDLVVEAGLQAYDVCAPIAVIEAAGGIVTDWRGRPAHGGGRVLAAANPDIHAAALQVLARAAET